MKKSVFVLLILVASTTVIAQQKRQVIKRTTISSPNKKINVEVAIDKNQQLVYNIQLAGKPVLQNSILGIVREDADFTTGLLWLSTSDQSTIKDQYKMLTAKRTSLSYVANKKVITVQNKNGDAMQVVFQLSNDGIAFRYVFPQISATVKKITQESTTFSFYRRYQSMAPT